MSHDGERTPLLGPNHVDSMTLSEVSYPSIGQRSRIPYTSFYIDIEDLSGSDQGISLDTYHQSRYPGSRRYVSGKIVCSTAISLGERLIKRVDVQIHL